MIPKIFHQIWLWTNKMPSDFYSYQQSWLNYNPEWKLVFWTDDKISSLKFFSETHFSLLSNLSEKSDYLRFCIVLEYGGVYIDTDFECLRGISNLLKGTPLFIWYEDLSSQVISGAIFWAIPNHPAIQNIFFSFPNRIIQYTWTDSSEKIWPKYITKFFISFIWDKKIFPSKVFYPIPGELYWRGYKIDKPFLLRQGAYAIHHWNSSWQHPLSRARFLFNPTGNFGKIYSKILFFLRYIKNFF